jgi:hypothetical protein
MLAEAAAAQSRSQRSRGDPHRRMDRRQCPSTSTRRHRRWGRWKHGVQVCTVLLVQGWTSTFRRRGGSDGTRCRRHRFTRAVCSSDGGLHEIQRSERRVAAKERGARCCGTRMRSTTGTHTGPVANMTQPDTALAHRSWRRPQHLSRTRMRPRSTMGPFIRPPAGQKMASVPFRVRTCSNGRSDVGNEDIDERSFESLCAWHNSVGC